MSNRKRKDVSKANTRIVGEKLIPSVVDNGWKEWAYFKSEILALCFRQMELQ